MTTASTSWTYRGVNLSNYAYAIKATGAPEQVPERRGENIHIPGAPGRTYAAKQFEQRRLTLAMYVDAQGTAGGTRSGSQLWTNLDTLKQLFATEGLGTLVHVNAAGGTRTTQAEIANVVEFEPEGPWHYNMAVEFVCPDPYWYGATTTVAPGTVTTTPGTVTVVNPGTGRVDSGTVTITGLIVDPRLAIGSTYVQYSGTVSAGATLVLKVADYTATLGGLDVTSNVAHSGNALWLPFSAGTNTVVVTGDSVGTATVAVSFATPYL